MIPALFAPAVADVASIAAALDLQVLLVGAIARDLCLPPARRSEARQTDDADIALLLDEWATLDAFLVRCEQVFVIDRAELRMRHRETGIPIGVAPCGEVESPPGVLRLRNSARVLDFTGVSESFAHARAESVGQGRVLIPSPSSFVLLKLFSFLDRRAHRDLRDLGHVARRAPVNEDEIFGDAALVDGLASGYIEEPDLPVWQLGRAVRARFSAATADAFVGALERLASESPYIRAQLVIEGGVPIVEADKRVTEADRLLRLLGLSAKRPD